MRKSVRLLFIVLFIGACGGAAGSSSLNAATIDAATCGAGDVQTAINGAAPGDTVNIPAGTCTWYSGVTIDKSISLIGAGEGATIINDDYSEGSLISVGNWEPIAPRVSGMTINAATSKRSSFDGEIAVNRASVDAGFRIDHITINGIRGIGIVTWDWVRGVIDHCTFNSEDGSNWSLLFNGDSWGGQEYHYGDKAWNDPDDLGTDKFVFVEDCTFNNSAGYAMNFADSYGGARYVLRRNSFNNGFLRAHGTDSTPGRRGTRAMEIYNNEFVNNLEQIYEALEFRSGVAVFYGNRASGSGGMQTGITLKCFRNNGHHWDGWGACDGSSFYDENRGGDNGACLDQPGRGQSDLMTSGDDPQPHAWPNQALSPVYIWGNSGFGSSQGGSSSPRIQENREFYIDAEKPGYTAFPYPHPRTAG